MTTKLTAGLSVLLLLVTIVFEWGLLNGSEPRALTTYDARATVAGLLAAPLFDPALATEGVVDSFEREASIEMSGEVQWVQRGSWRIDGAGASLLRTEDTEFPAFALTAAPPGAYLLQVRLTIIAASVGVVFGYTGPDDYWVVESVPQFETYRIVQVVDGVFTEVGLLGPPAIVADGTSLAVYVSPDRFEFFLDEKPFAAIDLDRHGYELPGFHQSGLAATSDLALNARTNDFRMIPSPTGGASQRLLGRVAGSWFGPYFQDSFESAQSSVSGNNLRWDVEGSWSFSGSALVSVGLDVSNSRATAMVDVSEPVFLTEARGQGVLAESGLAIRLSDGSFLMAEAIPGTQRWRLIQLFGGGVTELTTVDAQAVATTGVWIALHYTGDAVEFFIDGELLATVGLRSLGDGSLTPDGAGFVVFGESGASASWSDFVIGTVDLD